MRVHGVALVVSVGVTTIYETFYLSGPARVTRSVWGS